jgi:hypothetical protein
MDDAERALLAEAAEAEQPAAAAAAATFNAAPEAPEEVGTQGLRVCDMLGFLGFEWGWEIGWVLRHGREEHTFMQQLLPGLAGHLLADAYMCKCSRLQCSPRSARRGRHAYCLGLRVCWISFAGTGGDMMGEGRDGRAGTA